MPVTVSMTFDDEWAARFEPMIENIAESWKEYPMVQNMLTTLGITFEELTVVQKFKIAVIVGYLLQNLIQYEGEIAAADARQTIVSDVSDNFPLTGV